MATMEDPSQSDILRLMKTFESPPVDFDPHAAEQTQLLKHGFPRRPDPQREPRLSALWNRAFSRPVRYTKAELEVDLVWSQRRSLLQMKQVDFKPTGWGGVVVEPSSLGISEPANVVFAQWTIPTVLPISNPSQPITAGFWVGLDGYTNGQVLQAGVAVTVNPDTTVSWWAWTEWYTTTFKDPAVKIANFNVSVGDTVSFLVCAPASDHGFVAVQNLTTSQATSVGINARPGITSVGASAEWIVEGISDDLPEFQPFVFSSCNAGTKDYTFDLSPDGIIINIEGAQGPLTHTSIASPTTMVIDWAGFT
jgi:hypothetical protein